MNGHFAADIALMAARACVIECYARTLVPDNIALTLPSLREFRDTVNTMVEKWEAQQKVNSDLSEAMDRFNARQSMRRWKLDI